MTNAMTCSLQSHQRPANGEPIVAVVIPCYRVTEHLAGVIDRVGTEVRTIYCVIDGCPDRSEDVAKSIAASDDRVIVLAHEVNQGVGATMATGYKRAVEDGADIIVKLDGDGQMDASEISLLIRPIHEGQADYVKGNRFYNLEDVRTMPWHRLVGNIGLSFLSKLSSGYWNLFDPTNGFTAIHASVAAIVPWDKISRRYFFESDMLFRLNTLRAVVADVPLPSKYGDEESNLSSLKALVQFPFLHLRNCLKRWFYSYFLRDFNAASIELIVGVTFCSFGSAFGWIRWSSNSEQAVLTAPGTVMIAALPIILGWQSLLAFINYDVTNVPCKPLHPSLHHAGIFRS